SLWLYRRRAFVPCVLLVPECPLPNQSSLFALKDTQLLNCNDCTDGPKLTHTPAVNHTRILVTHYGGPDALQVIEEECPEPRAGEVRVRVLAAGVAMPDIMAREGVHPETPQVPYTPGWDLVGEVDRLGEGVSEFALRQIVAAMPIHGAYAQFICLPQH